MNTLTGARCTIDDAPLMESTTQADHEQAAELCGKDSPDPCPALAACGGMARGLQRGALDHRPVGTWAGVLYGTGVGERGGRPPFPREHGTDRGYFQHRKARDGACPECLTAHTQAVIAKSQKVAG